MPFAPPRRPLALVWFTVWLAAGLALTSCGPQRPATTGVPSSGSSTPPPPGAATTPTASPFAGVQWSRVAFPVSCAPVGVVVDHVALVSLSGDPAETAVVAVHCDSGAGNPPSHVYAYGPPAAPGDQPRFLATLLDATPWVQVFSVRADEATVTVSGTTYSSDSVPRCCPDERYQRRWRWERGTFVPVGLPTVVPDGPSTSSGGA